MNEPTLDELTATLRDDPEFGPLVRHIETLPAREAISEPLPTDLHRDLAARLSAQGFTKLYRHQALAWRAAQAGENPCVVTGTSSGKTLCYNLPVLQACLAEPHARALYIFPTKALAQDQQAKLIELAGPLGVRVSTYDGDTPGAQRATIRRTANVVLTNPDMLHTGILPRHEVWGKFLASVRYVAIDEMHTYRGVFGSHVGGVLRRLERIAAWRGQAPQVIACSATIGNPTELFRALTGLEPTLIDRDGAPKSARAVALMAREVDLGARYSPNRDTAGILARLALAGRRTLAFCRARVTTELVLRSARAALRDSIVDPASIESYRGGYSAQERREIERNLFAGRLLGLATTNAMELGVDVGALDAVLLNGFPGTIASFWQQVGRAGRGRRPGLAAWIAHDDPLERFLMREPELIFGAPIENALADPGNPHVLSDQLRCAAYERPLSEAELARFGPQAPDVAQGLVDAGELAHVVKRRQFFYPSHQPPAPNVSIRGLSRDRVTLFSGKEVLGEMERWRAMREAHAGAVHLHRGQVYVCRELDLKQRVARMEPGFPDHYTEPTIQTLIESGVLLDEAALGPHRLTLSGLTVTGVILGYRRRSLDGDHVLGEEVLDLPAETFATIGVHLDVEPLLPSAGERGAPEVHALEHALLAVAPLLAGCERGDLGSAWYSVFPDTLRPAVFIFDATPGGVGLAEALFRRWAEWLDAASRLLSSCGCHGGCPACVLSSRCEVRNDGLNKEGALDLLRSCVA